LPNSLYVAWQDQTTRRWQTVARLGRTGAGYELVFTKGVSRMRAIPSDLLRMDVTKRYTSDQLFPIFKNRLPSRNRGDFNKMAEWLNLKGDEDEFTLLSKFGLIPGTDSLLVYPEPEHDCDIYRIEFFVHGIRRMHPDGMTWCQGMKSGDRLLPVLDVQNPVDENAVAIRPTDLTVLIGYLPSFYAADVRELLSQPNFAAKARLNLIRLNEDAPSQLGLLCRFECPVPPGFSALKSEDHQPMMDQAA